MAVILRILWPYIFYPDDMADSLLKGGLPWMFLYIGSIFMIFGISASIISSFLLIKKMKRFKVYNRSIEIYLLSKYLENILSIALGIALIIGTVYLWFFFLEKLLPIFSYLENQSASFRELKVTFEEMLRMMRMVLTSFKDEFLTWCVASFLISLAGFAVPYLWFKGRRFTTIFLTLFLSGTVFSYFVSFLIKTFIFSELTLASAAVWTFSTLIIYIVFHLINAISLNKVNICKHCQTENTLQSKYCKECGKKTIPLRGK
jgi:ribosomal protein L40E